MTTRKDRYFRMQGRRVFAQAVQRMTSSCHLTLERVHWSPASIGVFISHQANQRIIDAVGDRLGIDPHRRFGNIADVGNTAAASLPLAMAATADRQLAEPGARTLLTAFGGGLTWGSVALNWPDVRPIYRSASRQDRAPDPSHAAGTPLMPATMPGAVSPLT